MAPGYETDDKGGVPFVINVKKSLYGLLQSLKTWFGTMNVKFAGIGFHPLKSDLCVYIYEDETDSVIPTLYMDDTKFASANTILLNKLKT